MSIAPRIAALLLAVASVAVLGGCVGGTPVESASPSPSATPVFATEEDALAAATIAYDDYQAAVDQAFITGDGSNLGSVAVDPVLTEANDEVTNFVKNGQTQSGSVSVNDVRLVDPAAALRPDDDVQLYACLDVTDVLVLDNAGNSVVSPSRPTRYPVIATLVWNAEDGRFYTSGQEVWDGDDFCV